MKKKERSDGPGKAGEKARRGGFPKINNQADKRPQVGRVSNCGQKVAPFSCRRWEPFPENIT